MEKVIKLVGPIDGDMLNEYDGIVADGGLLTKVKILAPSDCIIKVNGIVAKYTGEMFIVKVEEIASFLGAIKEDPHKSGYMDLLIYEQYFYPFYEAYQTDYRQKVLTSVQWAVNNGYQSAFLSECIFK